jgi:hypothetical protein
MPSLYLAGVVPISFLKAEETVQEIYAQDSTLVEQRKPVLMRITLNRFRANGHS